MKSKRLTIFTFAITLIFIMACGSFGIPQSTQPPASPQEESPSGISGIQTYPEFPGAHAHVEGVGSGDTPPVMGPHSEVWQNCGIYEEPVTIGNAIHSIEHGAVWLTYGPNLSEDSVKELQDLVRGHDYVLMSPYAQVDDVVLTAWGVQLEIPTYPDDRIAAFIDYYEQGPQNPEPGAPCSDGTGEPLN